MIAVMDDQIDVTLTLPEPMLRAVLHLCRARDQSLDALLRQALDAELRRAAGPAKTPNRADERLLAPLRTLLARDLGEARNWPDLIERLARQGFELREAGGGLALHTHPGGLRQCKASELGHSYSSLMRRFGRPFPGHSHVQLASRVLSRQDENAVIEPF